MLFVYKLIFQTHKLCIFDGAGSLIDSNYWVEDKTLQIVMSYLSNVGHTGSLMDRLCFELLAYKMLCCKVNRLAVNYFSSYKLASNGDCNSQVRIADLHFSPTFFGKTCGHTCGHNFFNSRTENQSFLQFSWEQVCLYISWNLIKHKISDLEGRSDIHRRWLKLKTKHGEPW